MLFRDSLLPPADTLVARHLGRLSTLALVAVVTIGCQKQDEIRRYTVAKPPPIRPLARLDPHAGLDQPEQPAGDPTDRTLGAIVPLAPQGWFFKLTGPTDAVAAKEGDFTTFLKSVRFDSDGKPSWTLPAGWQQQPGNQIRYATLVIPSDGKPLEVSVTALPNSGEDDEGYLLANVNRWRRQLRLPPIGADQLDNESTQIDFEGGTATLVNLEGHAAPGTMGRPPFFPGARDGN